MLSASLSAFDAGRSRANERKIDANGDATLTAERENYDATHTK
jgi:hypothetical protein